MLQKALLEKAGNTVAHAETGLGGLESASLIKPVSVVLDLTLPDTDGITVLKALRGMPAEIRPEVDSKYLYDLFPIGPAKQGPKVAGLPQSLGKGGY